MRLIECYIFQGICDARMFRKLVVIHNNQYNEKHWKVHSHEGLFFVLPCQAKVQLNAVAAMWHGKRLGLQTFAH